MEYFKSIPEEISLDILSRVVPTECLLGCKSVCKSWRNMIRHYPSFSKMHLHHLNKDDSGMLSFTVLTRNHKLYNLYYVEYNQKKHDLPIETMIRKKNINIPCLDTKKDIIGSYDGLICLSEEHKKPYLHEKICVCNPITKEYVRLPEIKTDDDLYCCSAGFGYVSSTDEYKVVQIMFTDYEFVQVHIYTLGSGTGWRNLGNFNFGGNNEDWGDGIFCNGVIYWLYFDSYGNDRKDKIVTFDLSEEKFCEHISLPPLPSCCSYRLGVFDGFLILSIGKVIDGVMDYDIWLLKDKNDSHDMKMEKKEYQSWVWSKEFRVENSKVFAATKTDDVLTYSKFSINIADPKASTSKTLVDFNDWICQVFPHKNTLVSLKELGEEDTEIMEPIEAIINL